MASRTGSGTVAVLAAPETARPNARTAATRSRLFIQASLDRNRSDPLVADVLGALNLDPPEFVGVRPPQEANVLFIDGDALARADVLVALLVDYLELKRVVRRHQPASLSRVPLDEQFRRIELVGQAVEHGLARVGDAEEARQRPLRQPAELRARGQHALDRGSVAAEGGELDPVAPGLEHAGCDLGRFLDQRPCLLFSPPPEAAGRRAALLVPALDEAGADLGGDEALAVEDPDGVAAEPDEQRRDDVVGGQRLEQRLQAHDLVLARGREPERRADGEHFTGRLDSHGSVGIGRASRLSFQRRQALANVLAAYEARHSVLACYDRARPLRVVLQRPVLTHPAARDPAQRMARRRIHERQVEVAEHEEERDVHQPVVDDERVLEPEGVVTLAVPKEEAGEREQEGERRRDDHVELLAGVEAALRIAAPPQPAEVVVVKDVDLAGIREQTAAVAGEDDKSQGGEPGERRVDVDVLKQRPPADQLRQTRQVEAEPRAEQDEEGARVHPVQRALGPAEAPQPAGARSYSHSIARPRRSGRSRAAPSSRGAAWRRTPSSSAI